MTAGVRVIRANNARADSTFVNHVCANNARAVALVPGSESEKGFQDILPDV